MLIGHSATAIFCYHGKDDYLRNLSLDFHTYFTYILIITILTLQVIKLPMRFNIFYTKCKVTNIIYKNA